MPAKPQPAKKKEPKRKTYNLIRTMYGMSICFTDTKPPQLQINTRFKSLYCFLTPAARRKLAALLAEPTKGKSNAK